MKVKSNFKDYYDFVGNQYGGGDPKVTYLRHKFEKASVNANILKLPDGSCSPTHVYHYKWLIMCGKYYLLLRPSPSHPKFKFKTDWREEPWHYLHPEIHADIHNHFVGKKRGLFGQSKEYNDYVGLYSEELVRISISIGAPVFCITKTVNWDSTVFFDDNIPILSSMGIPALIQPEQMYQELAYFISNVMVENADIKPPVIIKDTDLLISKGFDSKISFRHRKAS